MEVPIRLHDVQALGEEFQCVKPKRASLSLVKLRINFRTFANFDG